MASFSQDWLRDACAESQRQGPDHRRREVLFSVCLVESYLLEFVRDVILRMDVATLEIYFPPDRRRGIEEKFKDVLKHLSKDGRIAEPPAFGDSVWADFVRLVRMQDDLIHASISRPVQMPAENAPSMDLFAFDAGWAMRTACSLLLATHQAVKIDAPTWLERPQLLPQEP